MGLLLTGCTLSLGAGVASAQPVADGNEGTPAATDAHPVGEWLEPSKFTLSVSVFADSAINQDAHESLLPPAATSHNGSRDWEFTLAPYLWMSSIRADAEVGSVSGTADACFSDLLKQTDRGAQLRFEGIRHPWGFYLDGTYMSLGGDAQARVGPFRVRGLDVDGEFTQAWLDFGGMYRFGERGRSLDVMAGGRYSYLAADVSIGPFLDVDDWKDFWAPVIGGRLTYALSEKWVVSLAGDAGGFGVGEAADLSWGLTGILGYRLSDTTTMAFGYRFYDIQFSDRDLDLDLQFHGPVVGLAFRF
jgi:hypothetical protein